MSDAAIEAAAPARLTPAWLARTPAFYVPAVGAVAAFAGAVLFEQPPGLGLTLTAVGVYVAAAAVTPRRDAWRRTWWALAIGLAAMATLRDAPWVREPSLVASLAFAALGAAGFQTFSGAVAAQLRAAYGLLPGPVLVLLAAGGRVRPGSGRAMPVMRGVLLALLLTVPFAALFAGADATFAEWVDVEAPDLGDLPARLAIAAGVLAVAGALLRLALNAVQDGSAGSAPLVGRMEWVIALGALNALFLVFVALQVVARLGGHEYVMRTAGLTYAEYAREGFGQLVAVAALTLVVIAAARRWTHRAGPEEERLQRLLLGGLCLLTLLVLVSAHHRLDLYMDAYGLTRERVFAQWEILLLGGLFGLLIAFHARPWLPRAAVAFAGAMLLFLGLANPDRRIAEVNVERYHATGKLDQYDLYDLSADAAPVLARLTEREGCVEFRPEAHDGWAGFNFARHRAHRLSCR